MKSIPTLGSQNYVSDTNLLKRKVFASHFEPEVDLVEEIVKLLQLSGREKILDAGCGNGYALIEIRDKYRHRGELYGVDNAPGILKKALRANRVARSKIHFSLRDIRDLRFADESFDVIILKHVLHNIPNPETALAECRRVLKKEGRLVVVLTGERTRLVLKALKPRMARVLGLDFFPYAEGHVSLENINLYLNKSLWDYTVTTLKSKLKLKKAGPYLEYVESGRDFWGKVNNKKWQEALAFAKEHLETIVRKEGFIKDYSTLGIIVAQKKSRLL